MKHDYLLNNNQNKFLYVLDQSDLLFVAKRVDFFKMEEEEEEGEEEEVEVAVPYSPRERMVHFPFLYIY
jgi:hypothetical protein